MGRVQPHAASLCLAMALWIAPSAAAAQALASSPASAPAPTAAPADGAWRNGTNPQPPSRLVAGPLTFKLYLDGYYGYDFQRPADHTVFEATVAPRHDEVALDLAMLGVKVTGVPHLIGQLRLQWGTFPAAVSGVDPTVVGPTARGLYQGTLQYVQEAEIGWHFDVLHGVDVVGGIVPSFIGGEAFLPEDNWNYTHTLLLDFVPYYWSGAGVRAQVLDGLDVELWAVNGWGVLAKWHEWPSGGFYVQWRPTERWSLSNGGYAGTDDPGDPARVRLFDDSVVMWEAYRGGPSAAVRQVAFEASGDLGHEGATARTPYVSTYAAAAAWAHLVLAHGAAIGARFGYVLDPEQQFLVGLPPGCCKSGATLPPGRFRAWDATLTLDDWVCPWLLLRLEYVHRQASIPYFAGGAGITSPAGPDLRTHDDRAIFSATLRM